MPNSGKNQTWPRRILYGRRQGRPLKQGRQNLLDNKLDDFRLSLAVGGRRLESPESLFGAGPPGGWRDLWLEIGFGGGEHLAAQAETHPNIAMIGCEPFLNGVAHLLGLVEDKSLANVRIHPDDARPIMESLADASVGRAFLLFPDPWPKARHHKRRFINPDNLDSLARILRDGAEFRLATDHGGYCRWALAHLTAHADFSWPVTGPDDWRRRPSDWPQTRYEQKAAHQGACPTYLTFIRKSRGGGERAGPAPSKTS